MKASISLLLAFAAVTLAVPFRDTNHSLQALGNRISKTFRSNPHGQVTGRNVESDAVDIPDLSDIAEEDTVPASSGNGLTGDTCSTDAECTAPRTCTDSGTKIGEICRSENVDTCSSEADCVDGEVCVRINGDNFCFSEPVVLANLPNTQPPSTTGSVSSTAPSTAGATTGTTATTTESRADGSPTASTVPDDRDDDSSAVTEEPQGDDSTVTTTSQLGLTLDPCQEDDSCAGSRTCRKLDNELCDGDGDCRCLPALIPEACDDDSECEDGEGCFSAGDILDDVVDIPFIPDELVPLSVCISRAARDEAVCIASHSLVHISREELVFNKDAIAHVLCDLNESCATPGHMVQYKGKGMMMKSYCELTGCVRKVMKVNSPKYRRGLTVPSHTDDLVFTALAARFQSRAEEGVLSTAVRFGF